MTTLHSCETACNCRASLKMMLRTLEMKSRGIFAHSVLTALVANHIAHLLGLSEQEIEDTFNAGLLHDFGKLSIPEAFLYKDSALSHEQTTVMRTHSDVGADILIESGVYSHLSPYVRFHHELPDGDGYPQKLTNKDIPYISKIIAVADKFTAMTMNRTYRDAICRMKTADILRNDLLISFFPDDYNEITALLRNTPVKEAISFCAGLRDLDYLFHARVRHSTDWSSILR